jgi:hypothetical protein
VQKVQQKSCSRSFENGQSQRRMDPDATTGWPIVEIDFRCGGTQPSSLKAQQRQKGNAPHRITRTVLSKVKNVLTRRSFCFLWKVLLRRNHPPQSSFQGRDAGEIRMTSSAYYQRQASTLIRLARMSPDPSRAAALLLLANERLVLANQREPPSTEQQVPVLFRK